ncbi:DUF4190 domain-containing protein [Mycobacterium sp. NBC_00419]|uniref:DUF4190 domain-containing protein n=1 Tax=Mycobacterium sp. NBC_00419 TaxID=2975989 RepID=UPI002E22D1E1
MTDQGWGPANDDGPTLPPSRFGAGYTVGGENAEPAALSPGHQRYGPPNPYSSAETRYPPPPPSDSGSFIRYPDAAPQPVIYPTQPISVGYVVPVVVRSTNSMAVASFVCSLLCLSVLGVIFGHVALSQISRSGEDGKGLAIAGLVIGYILVGIGVLIYVVPALMLIG